MRNVFDIFKARPSDRPIEDVTINIKEETPDFGSIKQQDQEFAIHAGILENALYYSLPGGLYDQLLGKMLARKASHFRVSHTVGGES